MQRLEDQRRQNLKAIKRQQEEENKARRRQEQLAQQDELKAKMEKRLKFVDQRIDEVKKE